MDIIAHLPLNYNSQRRISEMTVLSSFIQQLFSSSFCHPSAYVKFSAIK